jgi:hypothetical protein
MSEQRCELLVVKAISCELFCNRQGVDTRTNRNGRSHRFSVIKHDALSRTRQRQYRRIFVKLERQGESGHIVEFHGSWRPEEEGGKCQVLGHLQLPQLGLDQQHLVISKTPASRTYSNTPRVIRTVKASGSSQPR